MESACKYRTGRTLGSGSFAIVKEAIHVDTNQIFAAKVINKKLMKGRESSVRNEIDILQKISGGHPNIVTLCDYFETKHSVYILFELCSGGCLLDRLQSKGGFCQLEVANIIRKVFSALAFIHSCDIVHRDLKPENILFHTPDVDSEIMISDFGLSRIVDKNVHHWMEVCGAFLTYMVPLARGYGASVDIWAMGVIAYMLFSGDTPFQGATQEEEIQSILAGYYEFKPRHIWNKTTPANRDFIDKCLTNDGEKRPTAAELCQHEWLTKKLPEDDGILLPHFKRAFGVSSAKAIHAIKRMRRRVVSGSLDANLQKLHEEIQRCKKESEEEVLENEVILHHHQPSPSPSDEIRADGGVLNGGDELVKKLRDHDRDIDAGTRKREVRDID